MRQKACYVLIVELIATAPADEMRERRGPHEALGGSAVIERTDTGIIAGQQDEPGFRVGDDEAPIADQIAKSIHTSNLIEPESEGAVGARRGRIGAQLNQQVVAVVKTPVPRTNAAVQ
jgi:hypothetical protein